MTGISPLPPFVISVCDDEMTTIMKKYIISNEPPCFGQFCFICEKPLTPPWVDIDDNICFHLECRNLIVADYEETYRQRLSTYNDNDNGPWEV